MASPKAKPAALKLLEGRGHGRDSGGKVVKQPPGFQRLPPVAPATLGPYAQQEWDRLVPELQRLHLTKPADASALMAHCENFEVFVRATDDIHVNGLFDPENRRVNPAVAIQRNAQAAIRAWVSEFGLSPAAEAKLSTPEAVDGDDNPFD
jgi:P27 family predicted phage terminase small subunit